MTAQGMAYKPVDRLPVMSIETLIEGPALERYREEGLPKDCQKYAICRALEIT